MSQTWKTRVGMTVGALALTAGSLALTSQQLRAHPHDVAPNAAREVAPDAAQEGRPAEPPAFQGGFGQPGQPPQPGFGGGFGGPGGPPGFGGRGGGTQMTATATGVYVLRGNTLYAFDPRTLKMAAKADLPDDGPRFGPQGQPGQPGQRPERF